MTTLKISNGDLTTDDYGQNEYVYDIEEAAQNVARAVLTNYNSFFDEGNELLQFASGGADAIITDGLSQQFITESINRLIIKQRDIDIGGGKIIQVNQVKTRMVGLTTLVFLVEVMFANGTVKSIVGQAMVQPTKLNHILNPSSLINV